MRETHMTSLYFTELEVLEALKLWCSHNRSASVPHFERKSMMEFTDRGTETELAVLFDGETDA